MKNKILFVDRDGTILREPDGYPQIDSLTKFEFLPGVIGALRRIAEQTDYRFVMVSNQDGLGTPAFPTHDFLPLQELMLRTLASEGVIFDEVLIDDSFPEWNSPKRKPRTGMVERYMNELLDRDNSYVIGDRDTDMQFAANMGIRGIFIGEGSDNPAAVMQSRSWNEIATFLCDHPRCGSVTRRTSETDITIKINLDGTGCAEISTGIGFFDHMLDQIARHGEMDIKVSAAGDLAVDEHHTIEDTAMVLGECIKQALGSRKGIRRYSFALPMDGSRAEVLLDMGGRSNLVWNARFEREYAGDFPTDMTRHFFDTFSRAAGCTIHINAEGENTHHTVEAIFKAFGRCLGEAVRRGGKGIIPSTKGVL